MTASPTQISYDNLNTAYDFFNGALFEGELPPCLITLQRKNKAYGYFAGERFATREGESVIDEIALNPSHFKDRTTEEILSTLAHEMVHLWQQHYGTPSRIGYHNKEWAFKMRSIGLIPSSTGEEGGKETGQSVSHYIADEGKFARSCAALLADGFTLPYIEIQEQGETGKKKAASKTKYTCPSCNLNAWAKPDTRLKCADCDILLEPEIKEPEAEAEAA